MQLAAALMAGLTLLAWRANRGGALPSVLLCGSWAVVYLLQSLLAPDMYDSVAGTLVVALVSAFFVGGNVAGTAWSRRLAEAGADPGALAPAPGGAVEWSERSRIRLKRAVLVFAVLALLGGLQYMRALGLFEASSPMEMLVKAGAARAKIFADEIEVGVLDRVGFLLAYSGAVLSIAYWYFFGWRWWLILPSLSVVLIGAAQAGRAGTLVMLLQWSAAVLLKRRARAGYRIPRVVVILPASLFAVFILGQLLREGFTDASSEGVFRVVQTLRSYLFGGVSAFAYYCDHLWWEAGATFGKYSFSSLFQSLGLAVQEPGIYDEYVRIGSVGEIANVFTAYRSFIDDFTLPGALLAYAAAGVACGRVYGGFLRRDERLIAPLVPALSWLGFSPLASLTYFNSFLLSLVLPYVVCRWCLREDAAVAPAGPAPVAEQGPGSRPAPPGGAAEDPGLA